MWNSHGYLQHEFHVWTYYISKLLNASKFTNMNNILDRND